LVVGDWGVGLGLAHAKNSNVMIKKSPQIFIA